MFVFFFLTVCALVAACNAKGVEIHAKYTTDIRTGTPGPNPFASQFAIESDLVVSFDGIYIFLFIKLKY